jgi:hypothetical protein
MGEAGRSESHPAQFGKKLKTKGESGASIGPDRVSGIGIFNIHRPFMP